MDHLMHFQETGERSRSERDRLSGEERDRGREWRGGCGEGKMRRHGAKGWLEPPFKRCRQKNGWRGSGAREREGMPRKRKTLGTREDAHRKRKKT